MYHSELNAIRRFDTFRKREIYSSGVVDFASNDYLGFSEDKNILKKAFSRILGYKVFTPKASQLVNGYHEMHHIFENYLCKINKFSSSMVLGSGFLANISIIESLVRKKDILFMDQEFHASGILASRILSKQVVFFKHNNFEHLESLLKSVKYKRAIVALEGVYSMRGNLLKKEFFDICNKDNVLLYIDEAHSCGVVGNNLLGVLDLYNIKRRENIVKMGTLSKAYSSYGAYILASDTIISFLENRAKGVIYTTAPSIFDISLAYEVCKAIQKNKKDFINKIEHRQCLCYSLFNKKINSLILIIEIGDSKKALILQKSLLKRGFLVGCIRPPTVKDSLLRITLRVGVGYDIFDSFLHLLSQELDKL